MAKRIQPKLSRPKAEVISNALHHACRHSADRLLARLYLASKATKPDIRLNWSDLAEEAGIELQGYAALTGFSPDEYLRKEVELKPAHGPFLAQALALLTGASA